MKTIAVILLSVVLSMFVFSARLVFAEHTEKQIDVCCAWDSSLSDGDLTYKISGGDAVAQATVRAAVEDWETAVVGLTLTEVFEKKTKANIDIKFKRGGGVIAGQALRKFGKRRSPFVKSVRLIISGMAFGDPSNQATIGEITRHEMGHALGIGHANFSDLMDPTVGGVFTISLCDVDAVEAANQWILLGGSIEPAVPLADHVVVVDCP